MSVPLIKGGQGRSAVEIRDAAAITARLVAAAGMVWLSCWLYGEVVFPTLEVLWSAGVELVREAVTP